MDQFYDADKTAINVDKLIKESTPLLYQLSRFETDEGMERGCMLTSIDRPSCWRLTRLDPEGVNEEVVLRLQGVMCAKFLPPISLPFVVKAQNQLYLKQSIGLTGFGGSAFQDGIAAIQEIHRLFSRNFPQHMLEAWMPGEFDQKPTIDMANRFFTHRSQANRDDLSLFCTNVDPDGVLRRALNDKCVHTSDNEVAYYERVSDGDHSYRYIPINPVKFRIGDVVEAQMSFATVSLKGNKHKMLVILRALTLLDDSPLRYAQMKRTQDEVTLKPLVTVKRKVGYASDDLKVTEERMTKMRVDGPAEI